MGFFDKGDKPDTTATGTAENTVNPQPLQPPTVPGSPSEDYQELASRIEELSATVAEQQKTITEQQKQIESQASDYRKQLADFVQRGAFNHQAETSADSGAESAPDMQPPDSGYVPLRDLDVASSYIRRGKD